MANGICNLSSFISSYCSSMNLIKATGIIILCYLVCIILFDLITVLLVTILPEPGARRLNGQAGFGSKVLFFVVWLVSGCFAGSIYSAVSFAYTQRNPAVNAMPGIVFLIALLLSIALVLFFYSMGEMQVPRFNNDYYVPGHTHMTYTFFISFLGICLYQWKLLLVHKRSSSAG